MELKHQLMDILIEALGSEATLAEVVRGLSTDQALDILGYVARMHNVRIPSDISEYMENHNIEG